MICCNGPELSETRRQGLRGRRISHLAHETEAVLPSYIWSKDGGAIDGKQLTPRMHGLWKAGHLADRERNLCRITRPR
jgi:hypothetical protein